MVLLPCSIRLIESIERSAASACQLNLCKISLLLVYFDVIRNNISYILHSFILIYFEMKNPMEDYGYSPGHDVTYFDRHKKEYIMSGRILLYVFFSSMIFIESGNLLIPYAANIKICNLPLSYVA